MSPSARPDAPRTWVARAFTLVEDVVYVGLGLLLAASAIYLLGSGAVAFGKNIASGTFGESAVELLDRILLILLVVELLYTVQVSFRQHALIPEPFLLIGLIAVMRRVLVLTAEIAELLDKDVERFRHLLMELGVLTVMIVAIVVSLMLLRKRPTEAIAERA